MEPPFLHWGLEVRGGAVSLAIPTPSHAMLTPSVTMLTPSLAILQTSLRTLRFMVHCWAAGHQSSKPRGPHGPGQKKKKSMPRYGRIQMKSLSNNGCRAPPASRRSAWLAKPPRQQTHTHTHEGAAHTKAPPAPPPLKNGDVLALAQLEGLRLQQGGGRALGGQCGIRKHLVMVPQTSQVDTHPVLVLLHTQVHEGLEGLEGGTERATGHNLDGTEGGGGGGGSGQQRSRAGVG